MKLLSEIKILSYLMIIACSVTGKYSLAQKVSNADFKTAIEIRDSIAGPFFVANGYGKELDFHFDKYIKEDNSAWFKFTVNYDTLLTFDIVPADSNDDFDFIVFKCNSPECLSEIRSRKAVADRICFSHNSSKNSSTGLSEFAANKVVGIGEGPAYAPGLNVKAGETYYLMVNYGDIYKRMYPNKKPKEFSIYFYNFWPRKKAVVLKNVLFQNNKSVLLESSYPELDKLVTILKSNLLLNIEIRGHTDNSGNEKDNQLLSEKRAKAVVDYLISKGIHKSRLYSKGFGSRQPLASNSSEEGKKINRRVEFALIMK